MPPQSRTCAAITSELYSMMSPRSTGSPIGLSSVPVGKMATRGWRATTTSWCPQPATAPRSNGRSVWPAGSTSWVATISSPIGRTFFHGGTAARMRMATGWRFSAEIPPPPSSGSVSSILITAFAQSGSGSPVSTYCVCSPYASVFGAVKIAPSVSCARTANPSIAEAW